MINTTLVLTRPSKYMNDEVEIRYVERMSLCFVDSKIYTEGQGTLSTYGAKSLAEAMTYANELQADGFEVVQENHEMIFSERSDTVNELIAYPYGTQVGDDMYENICLCGKTELDTSYNPYYECMSCFIASLHA